MNRRNFIKSALYTGAFYGAGGLPRFINDANAFETISQRILINVFLRGGPDMRHLVVPQPESQSDTYGYQYWRNRHRSHDIANTLGAWQQRFEEDYFPIIVGGSNWGETGVGLVGNDSKNGGKTFGIWKGAGWLIDRFINGKAAFVFNSRTGTNGAHDLAQLQLNQGNLTSSLSDTNRSGWGGRLARVSEGNVISATNSPNSFTFGPVGSGTNINSNAIDNRDLISIANSRNSGLNGFDLDRTRPSQRDQSNEKMARALGNYYQALNRQRLAQAHQRFYDHERSIRAIENILSEKLSAEVPEIIRSLGNEVEIDGMAINPDASGNARRAIRGAADLDQQIQNLYDTLSVSQSLNARVVSLATGNWDTHGGQRQNADQTDLDDPNIKRGIETLLQDLFKGPYRDSPSAVRGGFSALQKALSDDGADQSKLVYTFAGEFGRQIADNGNGTDHGQGNMLIVVGDRVQGGLYGDMFPDDEIPRYGSERARERSITPLTDMDVIFGNVADWVSTGSGDIVFPRRSTGDALLESGVNLSNLMLG